MIFLTDSVSALFYTAGAYVHESRKLSQLQIYRVLFVFRLTWEDQKGYFMSRLSTQSVFGGVKERKMSKKNDILKAALRLFAEKGYKETPITELSLETGAAEGTIFYHFKSKEEILLSILENTRKEITNGFEHYFHERKFRNGLEMMEGLISFNLYLATKMDDHFRLLHRHYPYQLAEKNPVCHEHLEAIYNCLVDFFEQAIVRGQRDGSIQAVPARKTALLIFTMVDGLIRFKNNNLFDAAALYEDLIASCKRILECEKFSARNSAKQEQ